MADIDLRNAERRFHTQPSVENLLQFWIELARARQLVELAITPVQLFANSEIRDFVLTASDALQEYALFGVPLWKLYKKLFLICHSSLFIDGWGLAGNEAVESSTEALTGLVLRRVFWEPDVQVPGLGYFHCHMGLNHHFTITIPYTTLIGELFLPLSQCPTCELEVLLITRDRLPPAQEQHRLNLAYGGLYGTNYLCINDDNAVQFDTHGATLFDLVHQRGALWLDLPLPIIRDYPVENEQVITQQQRAFRGFPSSFDPHVANFFELPGLESGGGNEFFMDVVRD